MKIKYDPGNTNDLLMQNIITVIPHNAASIEAFIRKTAVSKDMGWDDWVPFIGMNFHFHQEDEDSPFEVIAYPTYTSEGGSQETDTNVWVHIIVSDLKTLFDEGEAYFDYRIGLQTAVDATRNEIGKLVGELESSIKLEFGNTQSIGRLADLESFTKQIDEIDKLIEVIAGW